MPERGSELERLGGRPSSVGRHQLIGTRVDRGRDDECVGKPQGAMRSAKSCRGGGDLDIERHDRDREALDQASRWGTGVIVVVSLPGFTSKQIDTGGPSRV